MEPSTSNKSCCDTFDAKMSQTSLRLPIFRGPSTTILAGGQETARRISCSNSPRVVCMENLNKFNGDLDVEYTPTFLTDHPIYLSEGFQWFRTVRTECCHQRSKGMLKRPPIGVDHVYPHFAHLS
jgi:hypothetical protein